MIILFIHRSFPGQFRNLAFEMAKNPNNLVLFITAEKDGLEIPRINKFVYKPKKQNENLDSYIEPFELALSHAEPVAELLTAMKCSVALES